MLMFSHIRVRIDEDGNGTCRTAWGIWPLARRRALPIGDAGIMLPRPEQREINEETTTVYPVTMHGREGSKELFTETSADKAWRKASQLATMASARDSMPRGWHRGAARTQLAGARTVTDGCQQWPSTPAGEQGPIRKVRTAKSVIYRWPLTRDSRNVNFIVNVFMLTPFIVVAWLLYHITANWLVMLMSLPALAIPLQNIRKFRYDRRIEFTANEIIAGGRRVPIRDIRDITNFADGFTRRSTSKQHEVRLK